MTSAVNTNNIISPWSKKAGGGVAVAVAVAVKPNGMAAATCITHVAEAQKFQ